MVERLWVPLSHWLCARNWNLAASGAALTASRVANRVAVSTPLRVDSLTVVVIARISFDLDVCCAGCAGSWGRPVASDGGELAVIRAESGDHRRLGVDGCAELLLQVDELRHRRVAGQRAGKVEDL